MDHKLSELAEVINVQAKETGSESEEEEREEAIPRGKARGARA